MNSWKGASYLVCLLTCLAYHLYSYMHACPASLACSNWTQSGPRNGKKYSIAESLHPKLEPPRTTTAPSLNPGPRYPVFESFDDYDLEENLLRGGVDFIRQIGHPSINVWVGYPYLLAYFNRGLWLMGYLNSIVVVSVLSWVAVEGGKQHYSKTSSESLF